MTPDAIAAITRSAVLVADAIDRASERNVRAILAVPTVDSMRDSRGYDEDMLAEGRKLAERIIEDTKPKKGA